MPSVSSLKSKTRKTVIGLTLETCSIARRLGLSPASAGNGAIFTLHHVRPRCDLPYAPNAHLEIRPEFLDAAIEALKADHYDFIPLSDVAQRFAERGGKRKFACFTLDDAYRNNRDHALAVFEKHRVPLTIFVCKGFSERTHTLWWETLAAILATKDRIEFDFGQGPQTLPSASPGDKQRAFERIAGYINTSDELEAIENLDRAATGCGIDPTELTASLVMDGRELAELARHPLVSLGAHTISHRGLSRLSADQAASEILQSAEYVETLAGARPPFFAYPYGDGRSVSMRERQMLREFGLSGVTTKPGVLRSGMMGDMTALPRISLNGFYQKPRYVSALASGLPFSLWRS